MLKHLDLFSGIGGFSLGLERTGGFETVAFCEIDPFCQKVLKKHWPDVPIYDDVRSLEHDGPINLISGGYPCQPFSLAGKRQGKEDDRHLWPAMFELIQKHRPSWVIGENVAGHINMGLDDVLADLESEGYGCRTFIIPACAINAPHRRDRIWIVANCDSKSGTFGRDDKSNEKKGYVGGDHKGRGRGNDRWKSGTGPNGKDDVANTTSRSGQSCGTQCNVGRFQEKVLRKGGDTHDWTTESGLCRVAHGIPRRVYRLRALGNAVVPQIPEIIGRAILEAEG